MFYEKKNRTIRTLEIPVKQEPKGGDYNWMYGFSKKLVKDGHDLHPHGRDWFLAMKKYFEENKLTTDELNEMHENGLLKPGIELKFRKCCWSIDYPMLRGVFITFIIDTTTKCD